MDGKSRYNLLGFIDDKPSRQNLHIHGYPVYSFGKSTELLEQGLVDEVILAMPSASHDRHREIIESLEPYPVKVKTLPSLNELVEGKVSVSDIKEISIDDLLGRDPVPPNEALLHANIRDKVVLVTGAGGSIGSELCRQIVRCEPRELILFEQNEFCLYSLEQELEQEIAKHFGGRIRLEKYLGSINDTSLLERVFARKIHTIYHAAAYKHVPMVEENPVAGLKNNTFGTKQLAETASRACVDTFVLVSTDKAVRPTNVMGCSKRLAEMVLQGLADHRKEEGQETVFTMVRFGNVLGSSGSVVPKFRQQIRDGGPITLTHENIIRYFMSIPEAAQLVIQAGAMGRGGDVFVLDMGRPVRIADLAVKMIHLAGKTVRDASTPDGDIAIEITGLRPGEKLYEELLIGEQVLETDHPMIMRASESFLPWPALAEKLEALGRAMESEDRDGIKQLLMEVVKGYRPWEMEAPEPETPGAKTGPEPAAPEQRGVTTPAV
jgi:FlaA1/EpsC-like NDP-sugar epimerase